MNMYPYIQKCFFFLLLVQLGFGQTNKEIKKLEELIISAKEQNISIKNQTLQTDLAALTKKTAKGNIASESIQTFYYDLKEGKLKTDLNQDGKITAEENASADVYAIDEVEKAMGSLRGEKEKEFDNRMQLDQSARGWAGIALGQSDDRRKEERHVS